MEQRSIPIENPQLKIANHKMAYPQTLEVYESLQPGDQVRIQHEVKVGFRSWTATTSGSVVSKGRRRHSLHYDRNFDDKVFSDVIVLRREDGELTTVTLDEFSVLTRLDPANGAAEDDQAGRA